MLHFDLVLTYGVGMMEFLSEKLPGLVESEGRDASILKIAGYSPGSNLASALPVLSLSKGP
jgi:predicted esterase